MTVISISKTELVARLEELLPIAQAQDEKILAGWAKEKAAYLKEFRVACRAAAKLSYDDLAKVHFDPTKLCAAKKPYFRDELLVGRQMARALHFLTMDGRKRLRLSSDSAERELFRLLTWTPEA